MCRAKATIIQTEMLPRCCQLGANLPLHGILVCRQLILALYYWNGCQPVLRDSFLKLTTVQCWTVRRNNRFDLFATFHRRRALIFSRICNVNGKRCVKSLHIVYVKSVWPVQSTLCTLCLTVFYWVHGSMLLLIIATILVLHFSHLSQPSMTHY